MPHDAVSEATGRASRPSADRTTPSTSTRTSRPSAVVETVIEMEGSPEISILAGSPIRATTRGAASTAPAGSESTTSTATDSVPCRTAETSIRTERTRAVSDAFGRDPHEQIRTSDAATPTPCMIHRRPQGMVGEIGRRLRRATDFIPRPPTLRYVAARLPVILACAAAIATSGCRQFNYQPANAGAPYPAYLPLGPTERVQVFSDGVTLEICNASGRNFRDFDLWINQRYSRFVERLDAGQTLTIPFDQFWDQLGEGPQIGGFFAANRPTPVVLVQIQLDDTSPLVGLVAIPLGDDRP